jgi:CRP/FNR family cyclic AMP-dependent transcriptional regulator
MIELDERVAFLKKIHLFRELKDDEVAGFAVQLKERVYEPDEVIFTEGSEPTALYFVHEGLARVTRIRRKQKIQLAVFVPSDYFGEEALLDRKPRTANMEAMEKVVLLELSRADFNALLKRFPKLKPNFQVSIKSRKLARSTSFKWLALNEVIYFIARKHPILLVRSLVGPALSLLIPIVFSIWGVIVGATIPMIISAILLLGILGWVAWNVVDWGNDYYIVTNHRVIWLEKVIGVYDSRQEAPLGTVLSVNVETDMTGRMLDYGSVIVRTFVGRIQFDHVNHPYQAARMIEEQMERTKRAGATMEKEAMVNSVRKKLGLTALNKAKKNEPEYKFPHPQKRSLIRIVFSNLFRLRLDDSGVITYRKHWFVLIRQVWQPTFFILILIVLMFNRMVSLFKSPDLAFVLRTDSGFHFDTIAVSLPILLIPFIVWWVWQYVDWGNDIFQVTSDLIVDIDKTPFGTEERRSAQIESILSTEYQRIGLAGYVFNFGTVYITVGGTKLAFEDVKDPAAVQSDIDQRRAARLAKKRESEVSAERDRMSTWLAMYHQSANELQDNPPDDKMKNG